MTPHIFGRNRLNSIYDSPSVFPVGAHDNYEGDWSIAQGICCSIYPDTRKHIARCDTMVTDKYYMCPLSYHGLVSSLY